MGLLPCIRRGSDRWWLPRSAVATEAIGQLMFARRRTSPQTLDPVVQSLVLRTIESDPPLFIYAALSGVAPGAAGDRVETSALVTWLATHIVARFASGDAFLGAPPISSAQRDRWHKLHDHFRVIPVDRWLDDAALWLEAGGPKVSRTWCQQWPRVVTASSVPPDSKAPVTHCFLQQLARMTQRQQSLEQSFDRRLRKAKLGAIKELAYGLSHEINNPLANISTRAQQLQRGEKDPARLATLQRIIDQVYRAHEMIADLMFYANPPVAGRDQVDLTTIIESVTESFREETTRQGIRLEVTAPQGPVMIEADGEMIGEAVRVLIRNAVEAVGCQGTIVVSVDRNGQLTKIHVADSGPGLSEASRQHAFDPYYSGREAGRGLGLGLCRAYRIAQLHHAEITLAGGPAGCVATIAIAHGGAHDQGSLGATQRTGD